MYKWEEAGFKTQKEWLDYLSETEGVPANEELLEVFYRNRGRIDMGVYDENDKLVGIKPEEDEDWALTYEDEIGFDYGYLYYLCLSGLLWYKYYFMFFVMKYINVFQYRFGEYMGNKYALLCVILYDAVYYTILYCAYNYRVRNEEKLGRYRVLNIIFFALYSLVGTWKLLT